MRRIAILMLTTSIMSGCFTYAAVELADVSPDMSVRVRVTEDAESRLPSAMDRGAPIEGRVIQADGRRLSVLPELGSPVTDPIAIAQGDIQSLERRQLSQQRTWLTAGIGIGLGAAILLAIEGEPGSDGGSGNPPDFTRIPLARVRVP